MAFYCVVLLVVAWMVSLTCSLWAHSRGYQDGVEDGKAAGFAEGHEKGMIDGRLNQGVEITVARCDGFEHGFNRARELCVRAIDHVSKN